MKPLTIMIISLLICFAILLGIRPFLSSTAYDTTTYNGYTFTEVDNTWYFEWFKDGIVYNIGLRYSPEEVERVPIRGVLNKSFNDRRNIYITFDPVEGGTSKNFTILTLAATELSHNIATGIRYRPQPACTRNHSSCYEVPIVTCETQNVSVIYLIDQGDAGINLDQNCITLYGSRMELLRSVDRLLYQWYGVMGERWAQ